MSFDVKKDAAPTGDLDHKSVEDIFDRVDDALEGENASLNKVLSAFGDRAFGPVLTISGLILLTPLGAIPGAPLVFAIIIASFALQIILGRARPWLPKRLNKIEISQDNIDTARDYIEPALAKIDVFTKPRLAWAATEPARIAAAYLSLFMALMLLPLSAIPFGAMLPAAIIALLGMGLMARDGLLLLAGFGFTALSIAILSFLIV